MKVGAVFPQLEIGTDPADIARYARELERLGFDHLVIYDHVLGADPDRPGGWSGPYTKDSLFHEPFVLYGYLAAVTTRLGLATAVIILPQRQAALVAKQAAEVDVLSRGRLRLGVGLGWNAIEYTALGQDFGTRGRRIEEQIALMRQLWTQPLVTFTGRWHTLPDAGIKPLPIQRPIPIWFGGYAEPALRRVARLGDGWMSGAASAEKAKSALELIDRGLAEAGRTRADFGVEARIPYGDGQPDVWRTLLRDWEAAGATHASLNTMMRGFSTPGEHVAAIRKFAEALGLSSA